MPFLMLLLAVISQAVPAGAAALPEGIHATLDEEYPGWKLAPVSPQIQQEFKKHQISQPPSLVSGDFNQDGKQDFAVQIALTAPGAEEQIVIIFLARDNAFEENIVQSMGLDPTVYLWVPPKKHVLMVLGGIIGDTIYGYEEGRFQEIKSSEDFSRPL